MRSLPSRRRRGLAKNVATTDTVAPGTTCLTRWTSAAPSMICPTLASTFAIITGSVEWLVTMYEPDTIALELDVPNCVQSLFAP